MGELRRNFKLAYSTDAEMTKKEKADAILEQLKTKVQKENMDDLLTIEKGNHHKSPEKNTKVSMRRGRKKKTLCKSTNKKRTRSSGVYSW